MTHNGRYDLTELRKLPPSWGELDAMYDPAPHEPTLAQAVAPWLWGMLGFALGAGVMALMIAMGGKT